MITDAQKMACGNCGNREYKLWSVKEGIAAECQKCKHVTTIMPSMPILVMSGDESTLAVFEGDGS